MYVGTLLCDLDGTVFDHGTNDFLPGAREFLRIAENANYRIIFVTRRGNAEFEGHPFYGKEPTLKALKEYGLDHLMIIFDVVSPRILVDDSQIGLLRRRTGKGFDAYELDDFEQGGLVEYE